MASVRPPPLVLLFGRVQRDEAQDERRRDAHEAHDRDGELLLVGHLVGVGAEELVRLALPRQFRALRLHPEVAVAVGHGQRGRAQRRGSDRARGKAGGAGGGGEGGGRAEEAEEEEGAERRGHGRGACQCQLRAGL